MNEQHTKALEALVREAQAVADDHHRPRYTRLDEALAYARAALRDPVAEALPRPDSPAPSKPPTTSTN